MYQTLPGSLNREGIALIRCSMLHYYNFVMNERNAVVTGVYIRFVYAC